VALCENDLRITLLDGRGPDVLLQRRYQNLLRLSIHVPSLPVFGIGDDSSSSLRSWWRTLPKLIGADLEELARYVLVAAALARPGINELCKRPDGGRCAAGVGDRLSV